MSEARTPGRAGPDNPVRAWRQALLWLLRSAYVFRVALCYVVMARGQHARPDLLHAVFSVALGIDLAVFLAAFFEYFDLGRRTVLADCWMRVPGLAAIFLAAAAWAPDPGSALGWSRGAGAVALWALEFVILPIATLRLVRAIGRPGAR